MKKSYEFYKWRIWLILAAAFVMALFHRMASGVVAEELTKELSLSASQLGNIASITYYTYAFMQIPAGMLLDSIGPRKVSALGMLFTALGSVVFGAATNVYLAYLGRFLVGLGTSVIFISVLKAQSNWFTLKEFSKASGRLSFIGNLGGVLATFPLAALVLKVGWRGSFYIMSLICFIISVFIWKYVKDTPADLGFEAINKVKTPVKVNIKEAFIIVTKNSVTWRNFLLLFALVGCTTTFTGLWGVTYLTSVYELTKASAAFYISFVIYGFVVGSLFIGRASHIFKNNLMMYPRIAASIITIIWFYILIIAQGQPPLNVLPVLFFLMGALAMSHILCFTDIKENIAESYSGIATSIVNSGEFIGSSIISIFIGVILDTKWQGTMINGSKAYGIAEYKLAFLLFLAISVIGVFASFIKPTEVCTNEELVEEVL